MDPKQIENRRRYRHGRRARGLCGWEGCPEQSGAKYYCAEHRRKHRVRYKPVDEPATGN